MGLIAEGAVKSSLGNIAVAGFIQLLVAPSNANAQREKLVTMKDQEALLDRAINIVFERLNQVDGDVSKLEEPFRTVAIIHSAQGVIDNGGLVYFFESDWPNQPPYSLFIDAYRQIGKEDSAAAIEYAAKSFGVPDPEKHVELRNKFMQQHFWSDSEHYEPTVEWDDDICGDEEVWCKLAQWIRTQGDSAFQ